MSKSSGAVIRGAAIWLPFLFGAVVMVADGHAQSAGVAPLVSGDCTTSASGQLACTKSNGVAFAPSATVDATNAGNISSGTLSAARLPATGVAAGTVLQPTITVDGTGRVTAVTGLARLSYTGAVFGDSYDYGTGATAQRNGYGALMKKDTPTLAGWLGNFAVPGATMPAIASSMVANMAPNAVYPSTWFVGGGENDYTLCTAGTANCQANFSRAVSAAVYWGAVAPQQRTLMSNVAKSGTWSNNTTLLPVNALTGNASGSAVQSSVSGSTLSFTVPASNSGSFGIYVYTPTGTAGGAYTVSVDGTLQTDACNGGSTAFNAIGCGGTSTAANGPQRLRFAVGAGVAHSVVITTQSSAAVTFLAWDYIPSTLPANTNAVIARNAGAAYDASGWTAAAMAAVVQQARADGLSTVVLADARAALLALPDGGTSMSATAMYAGSTVLNHPRDGGHLAMEQAALAVEAASGFSVSVMDSGTAEPENLPDTRLLQWSTPFNPAAASTWAAAYRNLNLDNNYTTFGVLEYGGATSAAMGHRIGSGGFPDGTSGAYHARFSSNGRECVQKFTSANVTGESNFTNVYCVNPASGNAASSGQFQSYASSGAGFHGTLFTPASSSAACSAGDFADDANYHYVCTAANTWKRAALSAF